MMVPFWVPTIIRHLYYLGYPKRDPNFDNHAGTFEGCVVPNFRDNYIIGEEEAGYRRRAQIVPAWWGSEFDFGGRHSGTHRFLPLRALGSGLRKCSR